MEGCTDERHFASEPTRALVRPDGRWHGAVTQRVAPPRDEIEALAPELRGRLAGNWLGQAATEARVAHSFATIHASLERLGADPGLIALAERAVDDEHRHAALAEEMAGIYAGRVVGPHDRLPQQRPAHPSASSRAVRDVLWIVGQCALNETFASAYLSAARRGAKTAISRWAIRELLEDEIDHSRIGWAFLSQLEPAMKRELSEWLLPLVVCNLREWRALVLPDDDALAIHGVPPMEVARVAIDEALVDLLLPGFVHVGLDTRELERWISAGMNV